jgi:hippurate hydrolase
MAMLMGAAALIAEEEAIDGTLRVIFQPAEEPGQGAQAMIDDGLFERFPVDALYGIHNRAGFPPGLLSTRSGPVMASEDNFRIHVRGRGGHASSPHLVIDPLVIGSEIVVALQHIVARSVDPVSTAVISCTEIHSDGARNAIPSNVVITGDTRSFDPHVQDLLERRIREVSLGIGQAHGATVEVTYTHEFAPTINDPDTVDTVVRAATTALGPSMVDAAADPFMASEDFGIFAEHVPACLSFLGNGTEPGHGGVPVHSHDYLFNDTILPAGVAFYVQLVRDCLPSNDHS